jgi:uncharacterized protein
MKLKELLQSDLVSAMKSNDIDSKHIIRAVMSSIKYVEIEQSAPITNDEDLIKIVQKEIKLRLDAIEEARKGNRTDIIDINQREIKLLQKYLPEQLSDDELKKIIKEIIAETGASSEKDMGKIMPLAIKKVSGRAQNAQISKFLKELLQKE